MTKQFTSDAPSLSEIRRKKKPRRESCWVVLDPEMSQLISDKELELERAKGLSRQATRTGKSLAEGSEIARLEEELADLYEKAGDFMVEFIFQDPGMKKYDDLVTSCPPSKEQKERWKEEGGEGTLAYDPDQFVPRLIALCSYQPKITVDEAFELMDDERWGLADITRMFNAAQKVCLVGAPVPLSHSSRTVTDETPNTD